ncbi:MAG TPA: DUF4386 family protein [Anaerolineales bacterium]|nr:DUF4386 family protein [Anaerolineales bacterium]
MSISVESNWKPLFRIGGAAPLLTLVFYVSEFLFIPWDEFPASTEEWFSLFQRSKLLGLFYLNALDIFSIALLGVMFLALHTALKGTNESLMAVAVFFAMLGVGVFVVPRVAMLSMISLSDRYVVVATEAERFRLLAAGETLGALGTPTPQTVGFLFMAIGVLLLSVVMLQSKSFSKITAWFGILASVLTLVDDISVILTPELATTLMIVSGVFWIPWWLLISRGLFRLAHLEQQIPS